MKELTSIIKQTPNNSSQFSAVEFEALFFKPTYVVSLPLGTTVDLKKLHEDIREHVPTTSRKNVYTSTGFKFNANKVVVNDNDLGTLSHGGVVKVSRSANGTDFISVSVGAGQLANSYYNADKSNLEDWQVEDDMKAIQMFANLNRQEIMLTVLQSIFKKVDFRSIVRIVDGLELLVSSSREVPKTFPMLTYEKEML